HRERGRIGIASLQVAGDQADRPSAHRIWAGRAARHTKSARAGTAWRTGDGMPTTHSFDLGLEKNEANFVPLSPLSFIERTAAIYPHRTALIYGPRRQTWRETYARCRRLASALTRRGIGQGDTVAVMLPNV